MNKLLQVLQRLVDKGNSVIVIEHNLDVVKSADWIIDLGPEGGAEGGRIVAHGTPEQVAKGKTYTGEYLRKALGIADAGKSGSPSGTRAVAETRGKRHGL